MVKAYFSVYRDLAYSLSRPRLPFATISQKPAISGKQQLPSGGDQRKLNREKNQTFGSRSWAITSPSNFFPAAKRSFADEEKDLIAEDLLDLR